MRKSFVFLSAIFFILTSCSQQKATTWQEQYDLGVRYLSEGNYEEAIIAFTAAIEIEPNRAEAYVGRGDAYARLGGDSLSAAKADYKAAIAQDETLPWAWLSLAEVYIRQGDYSRATKILREALEKTGGDQSISDKIKEMENTSEADAANLYDDIDVGLEVRSPREGTLSLTGIEVHDSYSFDISQIGAPLLIQWWVTLCGTESRIAVWTGAFNLETHNTDKDTWNILDMQSSVSWYDQSGVDHTLNDVNLSLLADGLCWDFTVPTEFEGTPISFDLNEVTELEVSIYNINLGGQIYHKIHPISQKQ